MLHFSLCLFGRLRRYHWLAKQLLMWRERAHRQTEIAFVTAAAFSSFRCCLALDYILSLALSFLFIFFFYNFLFVSPLPVMTGHSPLWEQRSPSATYTNTCLAYSLFMWRSNEGETKGPWGFTSLKCNNMCSKIKLHCVYICMYVYISWIAGLATCHFLSSAIRIGFVLFLLITSVNSAICDFIHFVSIFCPWFA